MAQIFGCIATGQPASVSSIVAGMGRSQARPRWHPPGAASNGRPEVWADEAAGVGLGWQSARDLGGMGLLDGARREAGAFVLDGEVYRLPASVGPAAPDRAGAISALHARLGSDFVASLDGSFALALYDAARRRLLLATDRFSTRTLYWTLSGGRFLFTSELKGLLGVPGFSPQIDPAALAECFAFHRILSDRTLLENVERLPPATILEYDLDGQGVRRRAYWRLEEEVGRRQPLTPARLEAITETFRDAVVTRAESARKAGLSLSGGLDSRAIAAVLAAERRPLTTCTTGIQGCTDERLARRMCAITGSAHHFYALTRERIQGYLQALRDAVLVTDGMILIGGFPAGLTQVFCDDHGIDVLFRGHGGENARLEKAWPFQINEQALALRTPQDLLSHLRNTFVAAPRGLEWGRLFPARNGRPTLETALASLEAFASRSGSLTPAEVLSVLYLLQNDGREVPGTRNALRGHTEMALPYLDYRFLSEVLATEVSARRGQAIHRAIIQRFCPALLKVANSNTGAPVDASPLRTALSDKLNTLGRKLRLPGFRHYHYMEAWIRDYLAEEVRAIVLDRRTLDRGLFDRDYLGQLVDQARGDASLSRLLNLIVNLEIWCRLFLDGEARPEGVVPVAVRG
jgi:asparagine synthase (glutamine-hydrolysing)